jgi:hypothetical protein
MTRTSSAPPLEITASVLVQAEPARVWQLAMDWARQERWMLATRVQGGQGTGAGVVARTGFGPVGITDTMVITEWDPPRRCVVRHTGRVVHGIGVFEVIPRGTLSEFAWTEELALPWPASLVSWLAARPARMIMDASLRRFARLT